jgi:HPt (histidine-containing phosphotransfer) domain-containing protein
VAPAAPAKRSSAVLDLRTLAGIRAMRSPGAPDLLAKVAGIYRSNSRTLIDAIKTAVIVDDRDALLHGVHALKSSSANVGATGLADLCRDVETVAKAGDLDRACELVERLVVEHREVLLALEEQGLAA